MKLGQPNRGHSDVNNMLWDIRHLTNVNLSVIVTNHPVHFRTIKNIEYVAKQMLQLIIYHVDIMHVAVGIVVLEVRTFVKTHVKHFTLRNFQGK